jgi:tol-pal system protein YbgF
MYNIYILICLLPLQVFAEEAVLRKTLKYDSSNDYLERLDTLEKENQNLLGRIEVLEHNFVKIEKLLSDDKQPSNKQIASEKDVVNDSVADVFSAQNFQETKSKSENNVINVAQDKQLYDLALAALKDNKLSEAQNRFAKFIETNPNSSLISNAYFWYGESFFKQSMFDKAAINYLKSYKHSPKGLKASDALLKLALSLGEIGKTKEACSILDKLESEFPNRAANAIKRAKDAKAKFACKSNIKVERDTK